MYMQNDTGQSIATAIGNIDVDTSALMKDITGQAIVTAINNISSAISPAASNVTYNNTSSGLSATNVQAAVDELSGEKQDNLAGGGISSGDLNNYRKTINLWLNGLNNITNGPVTSGYGMLEVIAFSATIILQRFTQFATSGATMGRTYIRYYGNNQWYSWIQIY